MTPKPPGAPVGPLQRQRQRLRRLGAVAFFVIIERGLQAAGARGLPPSLLGLIVVFVVLLLMDASGGALKKTAQSTFRSLEPGYRFLLKWAPVFFTPALVRLPLVEDHLSPLELLRTLLMLGLGAVVQMTFVSFVATRLGAAVVKDDDLPVSASAPDVEAEPSSDEPYPRPGRPYRRRWMPIYALAMMVAWVASWFGHMPETVETVFLMSAALLSFVAGTTTPPQIRAVVHPMFVCVAGTWLSVAFWSRYGGAGTGDFTDVLIRYSSHEGAGSLLAVLLGPLVVALALLLYEKRLLLRRDCVPILGTATVASVTGLFGTALISRMLGLPKVVAMSSVSRYCTAPLAIAVASCLDASQPLAVAMVVASGFLGVFTMRPLLSYLGVRGARERGLSVGAVSHVLGTVSLATWDESAVPYSALAFVLVSSFSAALTTLPPVRDALLWVLGA